MKLIKDYCFEINDLIKKNETDAIILLSRLDGKVQNSPFKLSYEYIVILKEILPSNSIENIHTTYLDLLKASIDNVNIDQETTRKVYYNIQAIEAGRKYIEDNDFLDKKIFIEIKQIITKNQEGIRTIRGTVIKGKDNKVIYKPPELENIPIYLDDLETYINDQDSDIKMGYLAKMALCHFQFESIHPFSDCNGRTGRIINILFLILKKVIKVPIVSLSYYISKTKEEYYQKLNESNQDEKNISNFILYILNIIKESSEYGINLLDDLKIKYEQNWQKVKLILPKIKYEQFLNLFNRIFFNYDSFIKIFGVSRNTAANYIEKLIENKIVLKITNKKPGFLINDIFEKLFNEDLYK